MSSSQNPSPQGRDPVRASDEARTEPTIKNPPLATLILVMGFLACVAMIGYIWISIASGKPSAEALIGICSAIIGYLGGLLTPRN